MGRANVGLELGHQLVQRSIGRRDDLQQQQPHQHAVPLWNVPLDADPARLLAADEHVILQHVIGDVVEAHGRLHQRQAVARSQSVHHAGGGDALDDCPAPSPSLNQIPQRQSEDVMGIHEVPLSIHRAEAVGVPVGGQPQIGVVGLDGCAQRVQIMRYRFGMDAAKAGVHLASDLVHPAPRAGQHVGDALAARAVHRVGHHPQFAGRDHVQIHHLAEVLVVGPGGIEKLDESLVQRCLVVHHVRPASHLLVARQVGFDELRLLWQRGPAEGGLEFEAVVARCVVAGGDHHPSGSLFVDDGVGDGRGRGVGAGEVGDDAVAGQDAGHLGRVAVGEEAGVETDDDLWRAVAGFIQYIVSDGLGHQPQVGKSEGVRDDGAPAVRAEFDGH